MSEASRAPLLPGEKATFVTSLVTIATQQVVSCLSVRPLPPSHLGTTPVAPLVVTRGTTPGDLQQVMFVKEKPNIKLDFAGCNIIIILCLLPNGTFLLPCFR